MWMHEAWADAGSWGAAERDAPLAGSIGAGHVLGRLRRAVWGLCPPALRAVPQSIFGQKKTARGVV